MRCVTSSFVQSRLSRAPFRNAFATRIGWRNSGGRHSNVCRSEIDGTRRRAGMSAYQSCQGHRTVPLRREMLTVFRVVVVGNVLLATLAYLLPLRQLSRAWFILFAVLSALLIVLEKIFLRVMARYVRAKGLNYRTVLIVGSGRRAIEVASLVEEHKYWGYKILGFVSDRHRLPNRWARYRVYGTGPEVRS